jgi:hypothetical protein
MDVPLYPSGGPRPAARPVNESRLFIELKKSGVNRIWPDVLPICDVHARFPQTAMI